MSRLTAAVIVRSIKYVRNELAELFIERHISYVSNPLCSQEIALNLPTAIMPKTGRELDRARFLLSTLRGLHVTAWRIMQRTDHKKAEYKMLERVLR